MGPLKYPICLSLYFLVLVGKKLRFSSVSETTHPRSEGEERGVG